MLLHCSEVLAQGGQGYACPRGASRRAAQDFCSGCHIRDYSGSAPCAEVTLGLLPLSSAADQHGFPRIRPNNDLSVELREIRGGLSLLLLSQGKVHGDLRFDFNDLAIQDVRPILPLADGIDGCGHQHGMAGDEFQIFDCTFLADYGCQYNRILNLCGNRQRGIFGLDLPHQAAFEHP